ncbi:MAG: bifunctional 4-hydroxy-2-oxoglutarate aldolase/2-dehydro-3-deoxy-phosphogluconate aldolase [Treponema sp.]|jgi:2-dehydro-3-deoxyphosphogluconate aldolase/(4S)-4-hydroxy-2-oxoglutarate aldolase|nr:bifunctional 4-hydroxy-2-oxoglutarate aldolase/2-dehydro-3-deoxy-phosphogluconate aldolase [Treponema sp.]
MHKVLEELGTIGIIPVIKIDDPAGAVPLAKALAAGGIPCAEVTFRTAQGEEAIRRISAGASEILVGAGTVLTTDQADRAIRAGAQFIVSPGYNPKIVKYCLERGIPIAPGCSTPSDFEQALEAGLEVVKFFPAEQSGGIGYINAVAAPYTGLKFIPTGGINAGNIGAYIACDRVLACGGTWMVSPDLLKAGDFAGISALSREAVFAMFGFTVVHIGLNAGSEDAARQGAALINTLFGFPVSEGNSSIFAGPCLELMKSAGARGHIAIATTTIVRAKAYLERRGVVFDPASIKTSAGGNLNVIFARDEILGFAWHLIQKK